ncbi:hypothetical protein E4U56_005663 [Claviceps arundinis]|uniref:Uncharacterized protein n=1 Tax=Claviceps arundinis TaxID=1623583 RepID=A0A9P7MYH4_9HYPO|nr:hypothetical protein E4U56_005663 [Claviceps arundinis]
MKPSRRPSSLKLYWPSTRAAQGCLVSTWLFRASTARLVFSTSTTAVSRQHRRRSSTMSPYISLANRRPTRGDVAQMLVITDPAPAQINALVIMIPGGDTLKYVQVQRAQEEEERRSLQCVAYPRFLTLFPVAHDELIPSAVLKMNEYVSVCSSA